MSEFDDLAFCPEQFSGTVRLFPLPDLVLFPHVMQPLHVYEDRYRQLVEEALADDQFMAMAMLAPGWEVFDYEGRPPISSTACLCRMAGHHRLEDGRYNILVMGVSRVRIVRELHPMKMFREAEVELCSDEFPPSGAVLRPALQRELLDRFKSMLPNMADSREQLEQLLRDEVPLGVLTDIMSYTLDLDHGTKIELLSEANVDRRARLLLEHLPSPEAERALCVEGIDGFPPQFSLN